ncbi:polygalacturonase-like [Gossypium arboreum]|uniref:polygalacturonase-like n=1 Tax=Gossypium arboreum TaxID=29729 RepID=UPI0022F16DBF|nr:polygalacturonase-like [Gossypium arboreum]
MLILVLLSISSVEGQGGGGGALLRTTLDGPCKAPIELQVEGTVKAPADPGASNEPKWIAFNRIEILKLSSGGLFDGQRTIAYKKEGCKGCKNITFEHFTISARDESPNPDGIHFGRSNGVNVLNSEIKTSDDCVSIGDGSKNLVINGVTCGPGHGISIASLGLFENEKLVDGFIVKTAP